MNIYDPSSLVSFKNNAGKIAVTSKNHDSYNYMLQNQQKFGQQYDTDISKLTRDDVVFGRNFLSDFEYDPNSTTNRTAVANWAKPIGAPQPVNQPTSQPVSQAASNTPLNLSSVNSIYQDTLGRGGDQEGMQYWLNQAQQNGWDNTTLRDQFTRTLGGMGYSMQDGLYRPGGYQAPQETQQGLLTRFENQGWNNDAATKLVSDYQFTQPQNQSQVSGYQTRLVAPGTLTSAQASQWSPSTFNLQSGGTVEDRLNAMLNKDSPYMQRAAGQSNMAMNRRGLSNSSMAQGAEQAAMVDAALPIASQDASAFNQLGLSNQAAENRAGSENAGALGQVNMFNASANNQAAFTNTEYQNQAARHFADAQNADQMQTAKYQLEQQLRSINNQQERQQYLDGVASELIRAGLGAGVFADQNTAANWLGMIGDVYPEMGLSVTRKMASDASADVI